MVNTLSKSSLKIHTERKCQGLGPWIHNPKLLFSECSETCVLESPGHLSRDILALTPDPESVFLAVKPGNLSSK